MEKENQPDNAFSIRGRWTTYLYGPDGSLKNKHEGPNVVATNGKEFLASFLSSAAAAAATFTCRYIATGTGTTAEANTDTALQTEIARQTGTASYVSNQIFQVTATMIAGVGTGAITEYGLLSSSANGTLLARYTKSVINKQAGDTLTIVAQVTIG